MKHKRCTKVHINRSGVRMTSAGVEQAGTLLMSPSAANPNNMVKCYSVYLSFLFIEPNYSQIYHGDQIISNIEESCRRYLGTVQSHF